MQKIHQSSVQVLGELDGEKNHPCASLELMLLCNCLGQGSPASPPVNFLYFFPLLLVSGVFLVLKHPPHSCPHSWRVVGIFSTLPCHIQGILQKGSANCCSFGQRCKDCDFRAIFFFPSTGGKMALNIVPCCSCNGKSNSQVCFIPLSQRGSPQPLRWLCLHQDVSFRQHLENSSHTPSCARSICIYI